MKSVRLTIVEPFPLFWSSMNQKCRRANHPATEGPFCAPNSKFYKLYSDVNLAWQLRSAEAIRKDGYTVIVDVVETRNGEDRVLLNCPPDFKPFVTLGRAS